MNVEHTPPQRGSTLPTSALLTTREAAALLGMSESFLERDRYKGARIPFIRVGGRAVRYDPRVLAGYVREHTHHTAVIGSPRGEADEATAHQSSSASRGS